MKIEINIKNKFIPVLEEISNRNKKTLNQYIEGIILSFLDEKIRGKVIDKIKKQSLDEIEL